MICLGRFLSHHRGDGGGGVVGGLRQWAAVDVVEMPAEFGGIAIALLAVGLHGPGDNGIEARIGVGSVDGGGFEGPTGDVSREHLVKHDADGIQVRAAIHLRSESQHFRGHKIRCAHGVAGFRQSVYAGLLKLGQAEVCHLDLAFHVDEDIGRFDVAMDNPLRVRRGQGIADVHGDGQGVIWWKLALRADHLGDIRAIQILHDKIEQSRRRFPEIIDLDNAGMIEPSHGAGFIGEACAKLRIVSLDLRREDFDGDGPCERELLRLINRPHPALSQELMDDIRRKLSLKLFWLRGNPGMGGGGHDWMWKLSEMSV